MTELQKLLATKIDALGWVLTDPGYSTWFIETLSPAGEQIEILVNSENVVNGVMHWWANFDPEIHAYNRFGMKLDGIAENNANKRLPSLRVLVEDAEAIANMVERLFNGLLEAETAYNEKTGG